MVHRGGSLVWVLRNDSIKDKEFPRRFVDVGKLKALGKSIIMNFVVITCMANDGFV